MSPKDMDRMRLSGATLGAIGTNDPPEIWTKMNSDREGARRHELI
jgi:hypothetical protein